LGNAKKDWFEDERICKPIFTIWFEELRMINLSIEHFSQRYTVITKKNLFETSSTTQNYEKLIENFIGENVIPSYAIHLAVVGTYPTSNIVEEMDYLRDRNDFLGILNLLNLQISTSAIPSNRIFLKKPMLPNIMDVSQTSQLSFTSGIQRVVRETFKSHSELFELCRWSDDGNFLMLISGQEEKEYFIESKKLNSLKIEEGLFNTYLDSHSILLLENCNFNSAVFERYRTLGRYLNIGSMVYDDIPIQTPELTDEFTRNGFPRFIKEVLNFSETIYYISEHQLSHIKKWIDFLDLPKSPKFVYWPLKAKCICAPRKEGKKSISGSRRILSVGSFDLRKNTVALLACIEKISPNIKIHIVFVGPGGNFFNELKAMAKHVLSNPKREITIEFLTNISDSDLHLEYTKADFSVFLSLAEGFGLPVIESIHHGVPVLISNNSAIRESAGDYSVLSVNCDDFSEITLALDRLCCDEEYLDILSVSANRDANPLITTKQSHLNEFIQNLENLAR